MRYLFPLVFFSGLTVLFIFGLQNDPRYVPSPLINKAAPEFILPTLHKPEQNITMNELKGKVLLVNVWASWCAACRIEHPVLNDSVKKHQLNLYGLNYKDKRSHALQWLKNLGEGEQVRDEYRYDSLRKAVQ